jgi:hypothetical protein
VAVDFICSKAWVFSKRRGYITKSQCLGLVGQGESLCWLDPTQ